MKIRYFAVDGNGQLRKVSQAAVRALWEGRRRAEALGCKAPNELRLVSVVCDADLLPQRVYLLRVPLDGGLFTATSRMTLHAFSRRACVTHSELVEHHTAGWPPDFFKQLAVALDVPLRLLGVPVGVGGPLLIAAAKEVTPRQALHYLR
jgi:hypothetical protein